MAQDAPLHRYLLTFTRSYGGSPPAIWQAGAELVILTGAHPWGPFSFVAREADFGPSNGYRAGFPLSWISRNGRDLGLKWAANFDACIPHLDCSGGVRRQLPAAGAHARDQACPQRERWPMPAGETHAQAKRDRRPIARQAHAPAASGIADSPKRGC